MREILFRGKKSTGGRWVYGDLVKGVGMQKGLMFIWSETKVTGAFDVTEDRVISETVGQYTGLKDKNGQRIFEGDIVHLWVEDDNEFDPIKKYRAIVEFGNPNHEYNWGFQLKMVDIMSFNEDILLWIEMEESGAFCEVIGNIHDNPDLLKEE